MNKIYIVPIDIPKYKVSKGELVYPKINPDTNKICYQLKKNVTLDFDPKWVETWETITT